MCSGDFLFCIFYFLGFISMVGAFGAGIFIIWNSLKNKNDEEKF